ncbi:MAG: hypothetical protein JW384_00820 [Nitrosomonadaceae bacterium]|nr:hypothetical protein [Nitrosomonadaceae bacterium]
MNASIFRTDIATIRATSYCKQHTVISLRLERFLPCKRNPEPLIVGLNTGDSGFKIYRFVAFLYASVQWLN